jgi:hypothetical protein
MSLELSALKIDVEPKRLLITSEPYVIFTARGYAAVVNVLEQRTKREFYLYIGAQSLSKPLEQFTRENSGRMLGLEFWIRKKDAAKLSPYVIED